MNIEMNQVKRTIIVGVGGCGINVLDYLIGTELKNFEYLAIHTDEKALAKSKASKKLLISSSMITDTGICENSSMVKKDSIKDRNSIAKNLKKADTIIIISGMGGRTGTGASPIIAQISQKYKAFTVGIIAMPFSFESSFIDNVAKKGVVELQKMTDALFIINNNILIKKIKKNIRINIAMEYINSIFYETIINILFLHEHIIKNDKYLK